MSTPRSIRAARKAKTQFDHSDFGVPMDFGRPAQQQDRQQPRSGQRTADSHRKGRPQ